MSIADRINMLEQKILGESTDCCKETTVSANFPSASEGKFDMTFFIMVASIMIICFIVSYFFMKLPDEEAEKNQMFTSLVFSFIAGLITIVTLYLFR